MKKMQDIKTGKSFKLDVLDLIPKSKNSVTRRPSKVLHSRKFSEVDRHGNKFDSESTLQLDISLNAYQKTGASARQREANMGPHARNISEIFQNKKISFGDNINFNTNNINLNVINNNNHNNIVNSSQFSGNLTNSQISANYISGDANKNFINKQIGLAQYPGKPMEDSPQGEGSQKGISNLELVQNFTKTKESRTLGSRNKSLNNSCNNLVESGTD
jgi:hypothetical protein